MITLFQAPEELVRARLWKAWEGPILAGQERSQLPRGSDGVIAHPALVQTVPMFMKPYFCWNLHPNLLVWSTRLSTLTIQNTDALLGLSGSPRCAAGTELPLLCTCCVRSFFIPSGSPAKLTPSSETSPNPNSMGLSDSRPVPTTLF